MKIIAIEKELKIVNWVKETETLKEEAKYAYKLLQSGDLRELYFTENKNAVLILECKDKFEAMQILDKLPLVKKGIIGFEIRELNPYTGFTRLMDLE